MSEPSHQTDDNLQIPVIDIHSLWAPSTLSAIDAACRNWGFFQVINHGIDTQILQRMQDQTRRLFALPPEQKAALLRTDENPWGYFDRELTKNTRDWKEIYDFGPAEGLAQPQWPDVPGFETAMQDYYRACEALSFDLLAAIASNLGMPRDYLRQAFHPHNSSFVRLNYYPPCPEPEAPADTSTPASGYLGINHHTDAGAVTVLCQDEEPGLEVLKDDRWVLVQPREGALVINIGDIAQVWSNDRYKAALHRVIANSERTRISAPFFFNPSYATNYEPLPSTLEVEERRYKSINWGEFRARRAAGDYADVGVEVQIDQYRTDLN